MEKLNEWDKILEELEKETNKEKQVEKLQEIGAKLINEYVICADGIKIQPLWVEAYYYNEKNFPDCNTHLDDKQKNRIGRLYFHKKGYGGFDICLSNSNNYYLSFLLKATLIKGQFYKQTGIYDVLTEHGKSIDDLENIENVLFKKDDPTHYQIGYTARVGVTKPCFKNERLSAFPVEDLCNKNYDFTFAHKALEPLVKETIVNYIKANAGCTKKECKAESKRIFGWTPDCLNDVLKDLP